MRIIDLNGPITRRTVLSYGDTRSGKTRFAATWPRPLFLSDVTESGWNTVANMGDDTFFEPGRKPQVWGIEKMSDMMEAYQAALPLIAGKKVETVVIDSLTFYSDMYLAGLIGAQGGKPDMRRAYGDLGIHLRDLRIKWHSLGANVVWLCLAKHPEKNDAGIIVEPGGPMVPGAQGAKFGPGCDSVLYHRSKSGPTGASWEIRTKHYNGFITGGREGDHPMVDPLPGLDYRSYIAALTSAPRVDSSDSTPDDVVPMKNGSTTKPIAAAPVRRSFTTPARR